MSKITASKSQIAAAKEAFAVQKDKSVKDAFVTSDDQVFFNENDARNQARTLKENTYALVTRDEASPKKADEPKDISKMNLEELKAECDKLKIPHGEASTKADFKALIEEFQNKKPE